MRHLGILAGAALVAFAPTVVSAQAASPAGAPAGAPMQAGTWGQGGWQPGGSAAPTFEPGEQGHAPGPRTDAQGDWRYRHGGDGHRDYRHLSRGKRLPDVYMDPRYAVADWNDWGFSPPAPGTHWVRYYDDGLLVDARGRVVDARYAIDWDRGHRRGPHGYGMPGGYAGGAGYGYPAPGSTTYRAGPNTIVTTTVVPAPPPLIVGGPGYGYGGGYAGGYYAGGASVISVTPGVAVTTTTTTTDYETIYKSAGVRRAWKRPIRHYRPRCVHTTSCPVLGS